MSHLEYLMPRLYEFQMGSSIDDKFMAKVICHMIILM